MNTRQILDFEERAANGFASYWEIDTFLDDMAKYLNQKAEEGKDIVTNRMSEENFVRLVRGVKRALITSMLSQDTGGLLAMADMAGEVTPLIHTTILSVLAILVEEEVI